MWRKFLGEIPDPEKRKIVVYNTGFELIDSESQSGFVKWDEVWRIFAFKRDLFSVDLICFEFYLDETEQTVEVDEDMTGFDIFLEMLPTKFDGFDEDWFPKVAHPAFATNYTEIWVRK